MLTDEVPIAAKPVRVALELQPRVKEVVTRLLVAGIVRPSISVYASPAFVIPKKNGEVRLVVNYRRLNRKTVKEVYPLPELEEQFLTLAGMRYFAQIDLHSRYHQIEIHPRDIPKTSFVLPWGNTST